MASSSTSAPAPLYKRKRDDEQVAPPPPSKWRTRRAQEAYSSKLIDALRLVRAGGGREVRDAADRALAAAAHGRSRWSRAILSRRRRRTTLLRARLPRPSAAPAVSASSPSQQQPVVARKAKVLGRLVPGCRKLPFPALLAEVSDYIAALEMQVRTMNAVAQAVASVSAPGAGGSSPS